MKTVCFFGIYDRNYSRNEANIKGLEGHGYSIIHCNIDPKVHKGVKKYFLLIGERLRLARRLKDELKGEKLDFVLVAFPGHTCALLARILFPRALLVFDAYLSLQSSNVEGRKLYSAKSFRGVRDFLFDWHSIRCADLVLLDTYEHIHSFERRFGLNPKKAVRILCSFNVRVEDFAGIKPPTDKFIVHFHGSFMSQHGIEYVLQAAKILEHESDIEFRLIGGGQLQKKMVEKAASMDLHNVVFTGRLPQLSQVLEELARSHISLGMFGQVERAQWVILNKVIESAAFGIAIVTEEARAMHEVFTDGVDVLMCRAADAGDLAEKILRLKNDRVLLESISRNSKALSEKKLGPVEVIVPLLEKIQEVRSC